MQTASNVAVSVLRLLGLEELMLGVPTHGGIDELVALGAPRDALDSLNFQTGTLRDALAAARDEYKFVCVLLVSPQHERMRDYITGLFTPEVCDILRREYVVWAASVHSAEGYDASNKLRVGEYPYLAILYSHTPTKMICLQAIEGFRRAPLVDAALRSCQDTAGNLLVTQRADKLEGDSRRRLMEEQDAALREAEETDRRKAEEQRAAEERIEAERRRLSEERERAAQVQREKEERLAALKQRKAEELGDEPPADEPSLAKLRVTMLDGSTVERRFRRSDPVSRIAALVYVHPSYTGDKEFDISTTFPVKVLPLDTTIEAEKLFPRAVVVAKAVFDPEAAATGSPIR